MNSDSLTPVVLFGHGNMGRHHARILRQRRDVELVAIVEPCDVDCRGVPRYAELGELWSAIEHRVIPMPLVAWIATPIASHFPIAKEMLERGLHVFLEKPMAATGVESRELIRLSRDFQRMLFIGHSERYNPAFLALRQNLPAIGEIQKIWCERTSIFPQVEPCVGVALDTVVHDLDCVHALVGNGVAKCLHCQVQQGNGNGGEDGFAAELEYPGGIVVDLQANRRSDRKRRWMKVQGQKGVLECDFLASVAGYSSTEPLALEHQAFWEFLRKGDFPEAACRVESACLAVELIERLLRAAVVNP